MPETNKNSMSFSIGYFADLCKANHELSPSRAVKRISAIRYDSRMVEPNDVFIALKTDANDGHNFVSSAFKQGAAAAVVSRKYAAQCPASERRKILVCQSPLKSLQRAARQYRKDLGILFIAVTGSNGKTTTRSFIAHTLSAIIPLGTTQGNYNNHIGVPLSILSFTGDEWAGVIEMGANHVGEISTLSKIVQPDIGVITNIGYGHIGLFGSLKNIADAKCEISHGLQKKDGFLLFNGDDSRLRNKAKELSVPVLYYGIDKKCDCRASIISQSLRETIFSVDGARFHLPFAGKHFVYAALPAIFLGRRMGMDSALIAEQLASLTPVALRGGIEKKGSVTFILDCYNANPSSMNNALQLLTQTVAPQKRVAVLGDMLELGSYAAAQHKKLGNQLVRYQIDRAVIIGEYAETVVREARAKGFDHKKIVAVKTPDEALISLRAIVKKNDTVLLKASRALALESLYKQF